MLRTLVAALLLVLSSMSIAQGISTPERLVEAYMSALNAKDLSAYMALFSVSREQNRPLLERQFHNQVAQRVKSFRRLPFSAHEESYKKGMKMFGTLPKIQPEGWLEIEFEPTKDSSGAILQQSALLPFGKRDGRYFFAS